MKAAEEYLKDEISEYWFSFIHIHPIKGDCVLMDWIIKAMQEYADAYHQEHSVHVTDEEIENEFLKKEPRGYGCSYYRGLVDGAKLFRDQLKPVDKQKQEPGGDYDIHVPRQVEKTMKGKLKLTTKKEQIDDLPHKPGHLGINTRELEGCWD